MARCITPEQYLRTLRAAERVAMNKGMVLEAAQARALANEVAAKIERV